jgi:hypothetical protein
VEQTELPFSVKITLPVTAAADPGNGGAIGVVPLYGVTLAVKVTESFTFDVLLAEDEVTKTLVLA